MRALVTGGTGLLGSYLVERLLEQGHQVRALARRTSDISHLKTTGAEIVFGNVEDYDSLRISRCGQGYAGLGNVGGIRECNRQGH